MSSPLLKEFKDVTDGKHMVDSLKAFKWRDVVFDPLGPVKYDLYERIAASYLQTLPAVAQRLDAIEQHLEKGQGKPYVRSTELPDVGANAIKEVREGVALIERNLADIKASLGARSK